VRELFGARKARTFCLLRVHRVDLLSKEDRGWAMPPELLERVLELRAQLEEVPSAVMRRP
jgi:hypothetical protein